MSTLSVFVSCLALVLHSRGILGVPTGSSATDDQFSTATYPTAKVRVDGDVDQRKCPCLRNESTLQAPGRSDWLSREHQMEQIHSRNVIVHGMVCTCNLGLRGAPARDDYRHTPGIGSHKLHTRAAVWNVARKLCIEEGGHLAIINSISEAHILMDVFNRSGPVKGAPYPDEAFLGIHDLYSEGDWVTVLGDSLAKTGYTEWSDKWGGQPDNGGGRQNCGALMKEGKLDDVACDVPFPFFCELPMMQVL